MEKFTNKKFREVFGFKPQVLFLPDEKMIFQMSQAIDNNKGQPVIRSEYGSLKQDDIEVMYCLEVLWMVRITDQKLVHGIENVILFFDENEMLRHQAEVERVMKELESRKN